MSELRGAMEPATPMEEDAAAGPDTGGMPHFVECIRYRGGSLSVMNVWRGSSTLSLP